MSKVFGERVPPFAPSLSGRFVYHLLQWLRDISNRLVAYLDTDTEGLIPICINKSHVDWKRLLEGSPVELEITPTSFGLDRAKLVRVRGIDGMIHQKNLAASIGSDDGTTTPIAAVQLIPPKESKFFYSSEERTELTTDARTVHLRLGGPSSTAHFANQFCQDNSNMSPYGKWTLGVRVISGKSEQIDGIELVFDLAFNL